MLAHAISPSVGNPAIITLVADPVKRYYLAAIAFSYSGDPVTTGRLTVKSDSDIILDIDIANGGLAIIPFEIAANDFDQAIEVKLFGQSTLQAKVNISYREN